MSSLEIYPFRTQDHEAMEFSLTAEGSTGAPLVIRTGGRGITITRTGVGAYVATFADNPGTFINMRWCLYAATPLNVADHTVVRGAYNSTTRALPFTVFNGTNEHDLIATEFLDLTFRFKRST